MIADSPPTPIAQSIAASRPRRRLSRKHALMLALAVEVLVVGACWADRYRPEGIIVEQTLTAGHRIT